MNRVGLEPAFLFAYFVCLGSWSLLTLPGSPVEHKIAELIEPTVADMGYTLVRVRLTGGGGVALQIMAERADRALMTVEDCAGISRAISAVLDVADPIGGAYNLEVSSPGLDRPLVRPADYDRFAGYEAKLETSRPVDGRRRFKGRILGRTDDRVRIALSDDGGEVELPFDLIEKAKLVLSDELIAGDLHAAKA